MRISIGVLDIIKSSTDGCHYEIGGILGSCNGNVIDSVVIDKLDTDPIRRCSYEPNVEYLNQNIELWQKKGISFKGIFHTHFIGVKTLSCGDIEYINSIMKAMPKQIEYLYFPVFVLPDCELICYKANFTDGKVHIQEDILTIE